MMTTMKTEAASQSDSKRSQSTTHTKKHRARMNATISSLWCGLLPVEDNLERLETLELPVVQIIIVPTLPSSHTYTN